VSEVSALVKTFARRSPVLLAVRENPGFNRGNCEGARVSFFRLRQRFSRAGADGGGFMALRTASRDFRPSAAWFDIGPLERSAWTTGSGLVSASFGSKAVAAYPLDGLPALETQVAPPPIRGQAKVTTPLLCWWRGTSPPPLTGGGLGGGGMFFYALRVLYVPLCGDDLRQGCTGPSTATTDDV